MRQKNARCLLAFFCLIFFCLIFLITVSLLLEVTVKTIESIESHRKQLPVMRIQLKSVRDR
jgi:hypothetical protein